MDDHLRNGLAIIAAIIDPSLYCKLENSQLIGLNVIFVDDFLRVENNEWKHQAHSTLQRFDTTRNKYSPFTLAEVNITETPDLTFIDQDLYMKRIEQIPNEADISTFSYLLTKLAWPANTRPDLSTRVFTNCPSNLRHVRSKYIQAICKR